ncbi:iron-sulfur cluster assembly scaffold protein [Symmachiella dynata]|uniref:iron-sulfur cluster assembly scaffold protein n=1 Tax=Symmachiella dynata TaxID=2527995 RepID=UPI0030ED80A8
MSHYSETLMDHFQSPRNWGQLVQPDHVGVAGVPGRGRYLVLHLNVEDDRIIAARFQSHGCGATIAAGSMLTDMIQQRTVSECLAITTDELTTSLDGLPPNKQHCAGFAVAALHNAFQ